MRALPPLVPSASFHLSPGWVGDESLSKQMGPCENTALICNRRQSKIFYVKAQWRHLGRLSQLRQKLLLSLFFSIFFQFDFFSHWTRWTLCAPPLHLIWNIVNNWHVTFPASPYIPSSTFPFLSPLAASPPPLQNRHSAMGITAYLLHKGSIMDARAQWYCCHTSLQPCV